jgi:hypothetical protein
MTDQEKKGVHIVSEQGAAMMTLEGFGREGDLMTVQGALMGSWSTRMMVYPEEVLTMIGFLFNWQVIGYMLSLPYILIKRRIKKTAAE